MTVVYCRGNTVICLVVLKATCWWPIGIIVSTPSFGWRPVQLWRYSCAASRKRKRLEEQRLTAADEAEIYRERLKPYLTFDRLTHGHFFELAIVSGIDWLNRDSLKPSERAGFPFLWLEEIFSAGSNCLYFPGCGYLFGGWPVIVCGLFSWPLSFVSSVSYYCVPFIICYLSIRYSWPKWHCLCLVVAWRDGDSLLSRVWPDWKPLSFTWWPLLVFWLSASVFKYVPVSVING